jgi:hypothetical protein
MSTASEVSIWYVQDWLTKDCLDGRYYTDKQDAVDRRNELGYGIVREIVTLVE